MASKTKNPSQLSELIHDIHKNGIITDTREIFLTSNLEVEDGTIDHWAAATFIKNLRILENISSAPIIIHQITNGGDWNYGMAIYDAIKQSECHIILITHAYAVSMSSVIPQAADLRLMMPNADFMIHLGTLSLDGSQQSVVSEVAWAERTKNVMINIYLERCVDGQHFKQKKMNKGAINAWIRRLLANKQEVYFNAEEAVSYGFMDGIFGNPGFTMQDLYKLGV